MNKPVLIREFIILFNYSVIQHSRTGEPIPEMSKENLSKVDNCLKAPFSTFDGIDLYPTVYDKAAILFYVFIKNHPLINGNKRMAYLTMAYFLNKNKIKLKLSNKTVYEFTKKVAVSDSNDKDYIIEYIKQTIKPKKMNKGGLLVGLTDKNGGKGIEIQAPEGKIIAGGGEIIISEAAATKHCEELSRINQDGGGVAIPCDAQKTANKGRFDGGGKITTHAQYESVILETVGNNHYLHINGQGWKLTDDQLKDLLKELEVYGNPMTAAMFLFKKNKTNYEKTTMENNELKAGTEIEKEHMDTYNTLKARIESEGGKMPMAPEEFFKMIAQDHLNENPDYYQLIKTYVEPNSANEKYDEIMETWRFGALRDPKHPSLVISYPSGIEDAKKVAIEAAKAIDPNFNQPKAKEGAKIEMFYKKGDRVNLKNTKSVVGTVDNVVTVGGMIKEVGVQWDHGDHDFVNPDNLDKNFDVKEPEPVQKTAEQIVQELGEGKIQTPINASVVNDWKKVPEVWKNTKTVNEIKYINSPYDKGLLTILKPFFGTDALRSIMTGVNFDENGITVTDAHKLITLPYPNAKYKGVYATNPNKLTFLKGEEPKNDMFSGKFPNYEAIIPKASSGKKYEFSIYKVLQYTRVAQEYCNKVTWAVAFKFGDKVIGFNTKFLVEELEALLKLGHETAYAFITEPNKPVIFTPDKNYELGKSEILLLMPVMINFSWNNKETESEKERMGKLGARDFDFARELNVYFDFTDNNIHNADGSVAEFKMNYGEYEVLGPDAIKLLNTYHKKGSKSLVPILENFIVKDNKIFASDLETDITINNPNSKMTEGVYRIVNGAVEFDAFAHVDDYVVETKPEAQDYKFIISAGILKYYLEKAYDYTGKDDLRPIMTGFSIQHNAGKTTLFATNTHVLMKADLTPYVEVNKDQIDFSVVVSKSNILEFLDYVGEDALIFKANQKITTIESSIAKFTSKNIDGRYPNAEQVIPRNNTKKLTLNIKDLYNCLKGPEAAKFVKDYRKETVNIYDKLSETPGILDIFLGYYSYERGESKLEKEIKICSVPFTYEEDQNKYYQSGSLLLIMPVMRGEPTHFAFDEKLFHQILDTCSSEDITMEYSEPNRAYIVPGEDFDYSKTVSSRKQPKQVVELTPQQEWRKKADEFKQLKNNPFAIEAAETLEMLLTEKFAGGGKILWAVKKGEPDYAEELITEKEEHIEAAKKWAATNGYDRFRVATIDMNTKPDFTKTFADGGKITKDEYQQLLNEYDKTGAYLEDTEDTGDLAERARLKAKLSELESKIHQYERSYAGGGVISLKEQSDIDDQIFESQFGKH